MKKMLVTIVGLLVLLVGGGIFLQHQRSPQTPTVGILQLMSHPALDEIHRGVVAGLKAEGYQNGKNLKIDFQNAQNDQSNLKSMSDRFKQEHAAATIGIATPAAQTLANTDHDHPVIMAAISDPKQANLVHHFKHPEANITGIQHVEPVAQQITLMKRLMPQLKMVGVLYTSSDDSATQEAKRFARLAHRAGLKTKAYTITSINDLNQVVASMVGQVQAVYVPTDNTVASGMPTLVKLTRPAKLPVFGAADSMVKDGAVATYAVSQYDMGYLAGKMTGQILKGKSVHDLPVTHSKKGTYVINQKAAQAVGIDFPGDIVHAAETKGEVIK